MKNKIIYSFLSFALVFGLFGFVGAESASAQVAPTFPAGCSSNIGYSITNGSPCNGTSVASTLIAGCSTVLGYSLTTGTPCDGNLVAITLLGGCSSLYGYSTIFSIPCNGTSVASTVYVAPNPTPGLPTTGAGGNAFINMLLLVSSGLIAIGGIVYFSKKSQALN